MPEASRTARLTVLGALLLLALAAEDLRRAFTLLHPGALVLILLVAGGLAVREIWRTLHGRGLPPSRVATIIFSIAAAGLAVNALALHGREAAETSSFEKSEWSRLEQRASDLRDAFSALVEETSEPIEHARALAALTPRSGGPRRVSGAFEAIDSLAADAPLGESRMGITLYAADGRALAWRGAARTLPRELLILSVPPGTTKWLIVEDGGLWRLVALARPWPNHGLLLAVETLLRSAYQPGILDGLFDRSLFDPDRDRITFLSYRRPALELEDLFNRFGDMRRVPSKDLPAVTVALRSPDGALLGHAALSGESLGFRQDHMTWVHREVGNVILSLAAALLVGTLLLPHRRASGPDLLRQIVRLVAVWGLRFILLEFPLPASIFHPPLDDPGLFARTDYLGLLRSPLDFLLTSVAILASGVLVSLMITRSLPPTPSGKRGRAAALLILALLVAFLLGTRLPDEALKIVQNTRVDILTVEPTSPHAARMALQAAMGFTLTGFVIPLVTLLWAAVWAASPAQGGGPPPPPDPTDRALRWLVLLVLPCAVLAAFVLELAIQPAATSHLQRFLENDLTLYVRWIPLQRRVNLRDALSDVADFSGLAERIEAVPPGGDPTLAYELWQSTPLAGRGYAASLTVTDLGGRLVSRFSRNFPDILDARGLEPPNIPEGRITEFTSALRGRRINALHGHVVVRRDGDPVGTVTIHLRDDFGDLPGLSPPTPLQEALGEVRPLTRLLPSWYPRVGVAVYSPQGVTVLSNPRNPPPPPSAPVRASIMSDFREKHWQVRVEGGVTWYDLFFSSRDHLVALSFPEPGITGRIARAIRLSAQTLLALLILVAPWGLASGLRLGWRPSPARLVDALTRTHYRRLVTTFLLAALAPLTLLTLALTNFVRSEVAQDVIEHGWTVLGSLRHQVEDFGLVQEFGGIPDDAYLYSLTEESAEELSLFTDGVLRATSDREMYNLGIQPRRLSGDVQRRIELEGNRVVLDQVRIGNERYHRIHGVVSLGPPRDGILSILLAPESPEIARRARQIYDVMLIAYASVIFVMGLVAYVLARRIARPIRHLSQAAARIATGDLRAEVASTARDETGDLVESFNAMARALRRQRDALEERGNYIEKILLNATTGVLSVDLVGRLVTFNPIAASLLGIEGLTVGADLPARLETREDCAPVAQALRSCLQIPSRTREVEAELGGGEEKRNVRVKIVPFTEGVGLLIFLEDVTETVRSNRLAMWAEMARRIAHEIKNPLTPIKLSADHIRRVFADRSADFPRVLGECLRTIDEQIENLRVIAKQFSAYARHPEIRKEAIPVREFLEDVVRPYRVAPPPGVTVECDFGDGDGTAQIDRTILSQALVNMIENSLQAMPTGGRLAVRAAASPAADGRRMLTIEIADTGVGMDRDALARAFEPYFSTKGSGTGLGMAIARRAVEEHQGTIDLSSEPQRGTTARITIPLD